MQIRRLYRSFLLAEKALSKPLVEDAVNVTERLVRVRESSMDQDDGSGEKEDEYVLGLEPGELEALADALKAYDGLEDAERRLSAAGRSFKTVARDVKTGAAATIMMSKAFETPVVAIVSPGNASRGGASVTYDSPDEAMNGIVNKWTTLSSQLKDRIAETEARLPTSSVEGARDLLERAVKASNINAAARAGGRVRDSLGKVNEVVRTELDKEVIPALRQSPITVVNEVGKGFRDFWLRLNGREILIDSTGAGESNETVTLPPSPSPSTTTALESARASSESTESTASAAPAPSLRQEPKGWFTSDRAESRRRAALTSLADLPGPFIDKAYRRGRETDLRTLCTVVSKIDRELKDASSKRERIFTTKSGFGSDVLSRVARLDELKKLDDSVTSLRRQLTLRATEVALFKALWVLEDEAMELPLDASDNESDVQLQLLCSELVEMYTMLRPLLRLIDAAVDENDSVLASAAAAAVASVSRRNVGEMLRSLDDDDMSKMLGSNSDSASNSAPALSSTSASSETQSSSVQRDIESTITKLATDEDLAMIALRATDLAIRSGAAQDITGVSSPKMERPSDNAILWNIGSMTHSAQGKFDETTSKAKDAVGFLVTGSSMLAADVSNASRLLWQAATGKTLRAREVGALRRTARDTLSFVPMIIIMVAPITPWGHVAVFSFLQRYFPEFFPSQFNSQRQSLFRKYETLKDELRKAEEDAAFEEEVERVRAVESRVERIRFGVARAEAKALRGADGDDDEAPTNE